MIGETPVVQALWGQHIVFTGTLFRSGERVTRAEAGRLAEACGAHVGSHRTRVSGHTDLLVRGESSLWKDGDFGVDEADVAQMQAVGHPVLIVDASGFFSLVEGGWAYPVRPHAPATRLLPETAPYLPPNESASPAPRVMEVDLNEATNAHNRFQNLIRPGIRGCS